MTVYGYCRVSTKSQEDNTSLLNQQEQIIGVYEDAKIVKEVFTGATGERPEFIKLIKKLKKGDTLVCTKLDRFMRDTAEGIRIAEQLRAKGVKLHLLDMGVIDNTIMGDLVFKVMLAFAEFEKNRITERMAEGRERAKAKNGGKNVQGRKKVSDEKRKAVIELYKTGNYTYNQIISMTGVSRGKVGDFIREYKKELLEVQERASEKLKADDILTSEELSSVLENGQQKLDVKKV